MQASTGKKKKRGSATLTVRHSLYRETLRMERHVVPPSRGNSRAGSRVMTGADGKNSRDRWGDPVARR